MKPAEATNQFNKAIQSLAYSNGLWDVFNDFLDYSLLMMRWWDRQPAHFADLEKKYPKPEDHRLFAEAFQAMALVADDNGTGYKDPFGDWFMEHLSNDRRGQFFTPQEVCDMTAIMQIDGDTREDISVCDPTCGSGRMLLAVAKFKRMASFYAADIDHACCKMTTINYILNSMTGEVAWMDTLRMDHWRSWHVKKVMDGNGYYLPYYYTTDAGDTSFIQRLGNTIQDQAAIKSAALVDQVKLVKSNSKGQILLF